MLSLLAIVKRNKIKHIKRQIMDNKKYNLSIIYDIASFFDSNNLQYDILLIDASFKEQSIIKIVKFLKTRSSNILCPIVLLGENEHSMVSHIKNKYKNILYLQLPITSTQMFNEIINKMYQRHLTFKEIINPKYDYSILKNDGITRSNFSLDQEESEWHTLTEEQRKQLIKISKSNVFFRKKLKNIYDEIDIIRNIQSEFIMKPDMALGGHSFSHLIIPCRYLTGDFMDYFELDEEHIGFYMADVLGHGLKAGFMSVFLKCFLDKFIYEYRGRESRKALDPSKVLSALNEKILNIKEGFFITIFYGVINRSNKTLIFSNGGQYPAPVIFDGKDSKFINKVNYPVGIFDFSQYSNHTMDLPKKYSIMLVSDGIMEIMDKSSLNFKKEAILNSLNSNDLSVEDIVQNLDIDEENLISDDLSFLLIKKEQL